MAKHSRTAARPHGSEIELRTGRSRHGGTLGLQDHQQALEAHAEAQGRQRGAAEFLGQAVIPPPPQTVDWDPSASEMNSNTVRV